VTVQGPARELRIALDEDRVVVGPAEHRGDPAGAGTQVDEATGLGLPPSQGPGHERGLAPEPPVGGIGLRQGGGIAVVEHACVRPGLGGATVAGAPGDLAPDPRQRPYHGNAVAKHAHLRALVVPPLDRDLEHGDVERVGDGDDFDVPRESPLATVRKDLAPQVGLRHLRPALRVDDAGRDHELHRPVEGAAEELAHRSFLLGDVRRRQVTRPDGDDGGLPGSVGDAPEVGEGRGEVEIAEAGDRCGRGGEGGLERRAFAEMGSTDETGSAWRRGREELLDQRGRLVGTAVVHEDQLAAFGLAGHERGDLGGERVEARGLVVQRYHEREALVEHRRRL